MEHVTIKDVANLAQVSVGIASMAMNGKNNVSAKTKKKVIDAAEKLGYKPNKYARILSLKKTNTIGLIITDISNPFFGMIVEYIQQELEKKGYDLVLGISGGSRNKEKNIVEKFISLRVDGIIMVPSHKQPADMQHFHEIKRTNIPLCFITTYYDEIDAPCVMTDLSAGSYKLTRHVLKSGCRRIAYMVANPSLPLAALRIEGYRSALREAGIEYKPGWIIAADEASYECGYETALDKINVDEFDAILTMNDIMALGVLKYLKEKNFKLPDDISLGGYDDLACYTILLETPLTTVRQPIGPICSRATEIILKLIENPESVKEKILMKPELIVRSSTHPLINSSAQ